MPLAVRTLFTTGPGPETGGSKPGQNGCVHMPEKSGADAALCTPFAGQTKMPAMADAAAKRPTVFLGTLRVMRAPDIFRLWPSYHRAPVCDETIQRPGGDV